MTKRIFFLFILFSGIVVRAQDIDIDKKEGTIQVRHEIYGDISDRSNQYIKLEAFCKNTGAQDVQGKLEVLISNEQGNSIGRLFKNIMLAKNEETSSKFDYHLPLPGNYKIKYRFTGMGDRHVEKEFLWKAAPVNFDFAFATPHRVTIGPPDDSHRTLIDAYPDRFAMSWTYDNLVRFDPFPSYRPLQTLWKINCIPLLNGKTFQHSTWSRLPGNMPSFQLEYNSANVKMLIRGIGASAAAIIKIDIINSSNIIQKVSLKSESPITWRGINPAWADTSRKGDRILAGWQAPANQVLLLGIHADNYPVVNSLSFVMEWDIRPGQSKSAWLIRPYESYDRDAKDLAATNWSQQFQRSKYQWEQLQKAGSRIIIPDTNIVKAYYACLSDLFIMREPIAKGYIGVVPGTEIYRTAPNAFEPAIVSVALDRAGYHKQAEEGYRVNLDIQDSTGNWTETGGWANSMWGAAGFKSWAIMQHFLLTRDTAFLEKRFPQMILNARFQENQRIKSRILINNSKPLTYGLMPRGMGDGGLNDGDDLYGVFYMHNIWAVYADSLTLWAAGILNKKEYVKELRNIYYKGRNDLIASIERGKITEPDGTQWIPASPGKTGGSRWGVINALYPTGILQNGDPLVEGTLKYVEKKISIGGIHVHTGWQKDGMWVALSLDNFAEAYLYRGESEKAARLLYATINHGTPFFTWCEERGQKPGSTKTSGDLEHLWTPVALVRYVREALVLEVRDTLHLCLGADPLWVNSNEDIGVENAPTPFGTISYTYRYDPAKKHVSGTLKFTPNNGQHFTVVLHAGVPGNLALSRINKGSKAHIGKDAKTIYWKTPDGELNFEADCIKR